MKVVKVSWIDTASSNARKEAVLKHAKKYAIYRVYGEVIFEDDLIIIVRCLEDVDGEDTAANVKSEYWHIPKGAILEFTELTEASFCPRCGASLKK